jgi:hypothetical protein
VEGDGHEAGIAESVGRGTTTISAAEVAGDALETQNQNDITIAAEASAIAIVTAVAIASSIAIMTAIAEGVTILRWTILLLLGSGQRSDGDHQQNCQQGKDAGGSILP